MRNNLNQLLKKLLAGPGEDDMFQGRPDPDKERLLNWKMAPCALFLKILSIYVVEKNFFFSHEEWAPGFLILGSLVNILHF